MIEFLCWYFGIGAVLTIGWAILAISMGVKIRNLRYDRFILFFVGYPVALSSIIWNEFS